jgi:hypothetical protein
MDKELFILIDDALRTGHEIYGAYFGSGYEAIVRQADGKTITGDHTKSMLQAIAKAFDHPLERSERDLDDWVRNGNSLLFRRKQTFMELALFNGQHAVEGVTPRLHYGGDDSLTAYNNFRDHWQRPRLLPRKH